MFEKALTADVAELQALSVATDEVAQLGRRGRRRRGARTSVCFLTLNNSANDIEILNILNDFGM